MFPAQHSGFRAIASKAKKVYDVASGVKDVVKATSTPASKAKYMPPAKPKFFGETREYLHDVGSTAKKATGFIGRGIKKAVTSVNKTPGKTIVHKLEGALARHPKTVMGAGIGLAAYSMLRPRRDE